MSWFRRTPIGAVRWVVVDCETSGLDPARDRLLSVGAVKVEHGRIRLEYAFDARIAQETPSARENILIHGIGGDAQRAGRPLGEVIGALRDFAGSDQPVAFHAPFDAAVLRRHGFKPAARWHDLAALAPALFPRRNAGTLDDWLVQFGIAADARHDALSDAFASAQLLLLVLAEAGRQGAATLEDLRSTERGSRWL